MDVVSSRDETRAEIIDAAARLLQEHGPGAVTTRGVAEEAGVNAPAIYRLFGDKDGLLEAVAEHVMATFVSAKAAVVRSATEQDTDPLADLRAGWDTQIAFGLANPTLFRLLSDPDRVRLSQAARSGRQVLESRVHRVALGGRLRVSERRAVDMIQAAGVGTIQALLAMPSDERDGALADAMYDAVLGQILTGRAQRRADDPVALAVRLRAVAPDLTMLSDGERRLLLEWLDRAIEEL